LSGYRIRLSDTVVFLPQGSGPQFDLIIRNGNVVDGSGGLWFPADVAVKGDTIVKVGRLDERGT